MFQEIIEIGFYRLLLFRCILFMLFATVLNLILSYIVVNSVQINLNIDYFTNNYQNGALSIYATIALFFLVSMFATLSNRPQILYFIQKNHCFFHYSSFCNFGQ
jgi:hypothetical protein